MEEGGAGESRVAFRVWSSGFRVWGSGFGVWLEGLTAGAGRQSVVLFCWLPFFQFAFFVDDPVAELIVIHPCLPIFHRW